MSVTKEEMERAMDEAFKAVFKHQPPLKVTREVVRGLAKDHMTVASDTESFVMGGPHHVKTAQVLMELSKMVWGEKNE